MSKKTAGLLGFFYLIFQGYPNAYAKCWIDGNEDWTFIPKEDLLAYTQKEASNPLLLNKMSDCLGDMNIYIWDVVEEKISKVNPSLDTQNLKQIIAENLQSIQNKPLIESQSIDWSSSLSDKILNFTKKNKYTL